MNKLEKVLLVDDNELSNFITEAILKEHNPNLIIEICKNGEEAVLYMEQLVSDTAHFMFLDINMPKMSGFEFLDWYHSNGYTGKMKIVMFTTTIRDEEIKRSLAYKDVVHFLEKPLNKEKINALIEKVL